MSIAFGFAVAAGVALIVLRNIRYRRELKQMTPEQLRAFREEEKFELQSW